MPTLLDIERAVRSALLDPESDDALRHIVTDGIAPEDRLAIYRNTFVSGAVKALELNFPAVRKLVGDEFFEGVARIHIDANPPESACLDDYGATFPDFLADFPPAQSLGYLGDVAHLEWLVSRVLHAADIPPLDIGRLSALPPEDHGRMRFAPSPTAGLVHVNCPADEIWRAVLEGDDDAMAAIDLNAGPAWLVVRRATTGIDITRLNEAEARFFLLLTDGVPLDNALAAAKDIDAPAVLARFLGQGVFAGFNLQEPQGASR